MTFLPFFCYKSFKKNVVEPFPNVYYCPLRLIQIQVHNTGTDRDPTSDLALNIMYLRINRILFK